MCPRDRRARLRSIGALLALLLAAASIPAQAQSPPAPEGHRLYLPYVSLPEALSLELVDRQGYGITLAAEGRHAYLSIDGWLRVLDLSDAARPVEVAAVELAQTPIGSEVHRGWLYLRSAQAPEALEIWDVRQPERPRPAGRFEPPRGLRGMDFHADRAYVCESAGISIFALEQGSGRPRPLGRIALPDQTEAISASACHALAGDRVAIGDGRPAPEDSSLVYGPGLRIFDASDPDRPRELATLRSSGITRGYVSQIWADPELIVEVWHQIPFSGAYDVLTLHSLVPETGELQERRSVSLENRIEGGIERILFAGPRILVLGRGWLRIVEASDIDRAYVASRIDFDPQLDDAALVEGHLLTAGRELRVTRISEPSEPVTVGRFAGFTGHPTVVVGHRDSRRLAAYQSRQKQLTLFDASGGAPGQPRALALEDLGLTQTDVAIAFTPEGRLLVASWHELLLLEPDGQVVARALHQAGTTGGSISDLAVDPGSGTAYVVGQAGLAAVRIDGDRLELLGEMVYGAPDVFLVSLAVEAGLGVLGWSNWRAAEAGLIVLDLQDPRAPSRLADIPLEGGSVGGLTLHDGQALVVHDRWLSRYDLRRSESAQWQFEDARMGYPSDVLSYGDWAFVSDGGGRLHAIDLRDPARPRLASSLAIPGNPGRLAALPGRIFVAAASGGLATVAIQAGPGFGPGILGGTLAR